MNNTTDWSEKGWFELTPIPSYYKEPELPLRLVGSYPDDDLTESPAAE